MKIYTEHCSWNEEKNYRGASALAKSGRDADQVTRAMAKITRAKARTALARGEILTGKRPAGLQTEGNQARELVRDRTPARENQ
jgi:hypothetical protein